MRVLNSKFYQAFMILWIVSGGLGVAYWLKGDFLVVDSVVVFSKWIAGILGVILLSPIATLLWSFKPKSGVKVAPRWVIRYLSIPAFFFAFLISMYFFLSNAAPSIYTGLYGTSHNETLVIKKKYTTGKRVDKYWVSFYKYGNSLRVNYCDYKSFKTNGTVVGNVLKSKYGIYVRSYENANNLVCAKAGEIPTPSSSHGWN